MIDINLTCRKKNHQATTKISDWSSVFTTHVLHDIACTIIIARRDLVFLCVWPDYPVGVVKHDCTSLQFITHKDDEGIRVTSPYMQFLQILKPFCTSRVDAITLTLMYKYMYM